MCLKKKKKNDGVFLHVCSATPGSFINGPKGCSTKLTSYITAHITDEAS